MEERGNGLRKGGLGLLSMKPRKPWLQKTINECNVRGE